MWKGELEIKMENAPKTILNKKEKGLNRHWKNYIDKDYLGSHNLEEGEEMLLTITKFEGEELVQKHDGKKDEKVAKQVLYFKEEVPKMIINVTNASTIANLYGTHPDQWIGKKIQVYAMPVKAFGKTQDALRIRDFVPRETLDVKSYTKQLEVANNTTELKAIWITFPVHIRENADLIKEKDSLKAILDSEAKNS